MKLLLFSILLTFSNTLFGQSPIRDTAIGIPITFIDTCYEIERKALNNLVTNKRHSQPLIIANGIVIRGENLSNDTTLVKSIKVKKCPEAFNDYGYLGLNGVIEIKTKQKFKTTTPNTIRLNQFSDMSDSIVFALNGDLITDLNLKISTASIKEIELLKKGTKKGTNLELTNIDCISIWTLNDIERFTPLGMCRVLLNTNYKME